ncbi:MAG: arginase family protein [Candidatus Pacearchaeota archaeon]
MMIVKVPGLNNMGHNDGCRNAGNAIISELKQLRDISSIPLEEIHVNNSKLDEQEKLICENSKELLEEHEKVIFLGGDHSITYSTGKAFLECFGGDSYLIVFDAHPNTIPAMNKPTHDEWLSALVGNGFPTKNIILIGLRTIKLDERAFLDKNKIRYYELPKIEDFEVFCDFVMEFANKPKNSVYISFDIGAVDPAFAPSTGHLEPGGFSSREILYFANRLSKLRNLRAVDVVEVNSEADKEKNNVTVKLASRIVKEFL